VPPPVPTRRLAAFPTTTLHLANDGRCYKATSSNAKSMRKPWVSKPFGQFNPTVFQVTCQGKDSMLFDAFAQEKITKHKRLTNNTMLPDMDWVPADRNAAGAGAFTYTGMGRIFDKKGLPADPYFLRVLATTPILSCHQDIRVRIVDPCGGLTAPFGLGKGFNIVESKDTQNTLGGTYIIAHFQP